MKKYARKCSECGKLMNEGYVVGGGQDYYCDEACLHTHVTQKEWNEMYDDGSDDNYWTTWEDEDDFQYYEDGT